MHITLRDTSGAVRQLPSDCRFVEMRDSDNRLAAVTYVADDNTIHVHGPGDPEFDQYCKMFAVPNPSDKVIKA